LTLLRLRARHRAAVVELGMNHAGEIATLARIAAPTIALVNNAQREHQEFMSGVEAVARENGSVYGALGRGGIAVYPAADAYAPLWRELAAGRTCRTFALDADADADAAGRDGGAGPEAEFGARAVWRPEARLWTLTLRTPAGSTTTTLRQPGRHNVRNALAAAACAMAAGAPLQAAAQGIADFTPVAGRSQTLTLQLGGREATLIDDSYNANPDSVLAAIDVLAALPGPRWLVLGDMGEVGSQGPQFHAEVGARARAAGIEHFWSAGALCAHAGAERHYAGVAELLQALPERPAAAAILVKGSRFMKMEQVVRALQQEAADAA
ncbi:MAG: UDP-N-acetylmuramoylalanyl-D-glutamyl-2, 6-diaminopimelate--D-alanyl-D-alanine ligase, partial [Burkholderiales bacterium]|nr:UDP-N-acetylmuramoylalanyl-D-glutamyl-2, 6-diaminopimelate--D-alanyl-D-alanine ligase [Burkholderiales bacterium]